MRLQLLRMLNGNIIGINYNQQDIFKASISKSFESLLLNSIICKTINYKAINMFIFSTLIPIIKPETEPASFVSSFPSMFVVSSMAFLGDSCVSWRWMDGKSFNIYWRRAIRYNVNKITWKLPFKYSSKCFSAWAVILFPEC